MGNKISIEEVYFNEIITGHRLYVGLNIKSEYENINASKEEIDERINALVCMLFKYFISSNSVKVKKDIIKSISNIYDNIYNEVP